MVEFLNASITAYKFRLEIKSRIFNGKNDKVSEKIA